MNFTEMTIEALEERKAAIAQELESPEADLDALEEEARAIREEMESRKAAETKKAEIRAAVALGEGEIVKAVDTEERKTVTNAEVRNTKEYIDAYVNYWKTGDDTEARALLSENAEGVVPVPVILEERIRTAWERSGLMDVVGKSYMKGNVKIGFEFSATGAEIHEEGGAAVEPEQLELGSIVIIPQSIKKLIRISDEAMDLTGQYFIDYLYDELAYQIAKKGEEVLLGLIADAPTTATKQAVSVAELTVTELGVGTVATALGMLNADATNPVIVTTRANWSALKVAAYSAGYAIDPFEGLRVLFASEAALGDFAMIVGDFGEGVLANFPAGAEIQIKVDDRTRMAEDMVDILGRQFVGFGLVTDKALCRVKVGE